VKSERNKHSNGNTKVPKVHVYIASCVPGEFLLFVIDFAVIELDPFVAIMMMLINMVAVLFMFDLM